MNHRNIPQFIPPHIEQGDKQDTTQSTPPVSLHRLTPEAYRALERQLDDARVGPTTTDQQVAFKLGIQHALKAVRDGFTVGT